MYEVALELINKINEYGFVSYIVGGFPRDLYINRKCIDIDICTNAVPENLKNIFKGAVLANQSYGGITIVYKKVRFEITTFRKEIKYENNRFPVKIKYINSLSEDLKRRDFTINTLCINNKGEIIDLLNARNDLDNEIIKCVGKADNKIKEDILRSLRAIRFATILNFDIDKNLKKAISKHAKILSKLSYYRKKEELDKIFISTNANYGLNLIKDLGLAKYLDLPNLNKIIITTTSIGIWAQLNVNDIYPFSANEKKMIEKINCALNENLLDNKTLYNYGLYICTIACEIKEIDKVLLAEKYNSLPINNKKDINIKPIDICNILKRNPGKFIKEIINDLENVILDNKLENNCDKIKEYIINKYI